jgi:microfibrillar-associated protein 1
VEFEAWRLRELKRLQRDGALRQQFELEKFETERRRGLTEAERRSEDQALGKLDVKDKEKWAFMQKYYHKGAFYMDDSEMETGDVRTKNYSAPTLEDKFDKAALPKVMQVKKFGFSGRTKYTHLKDQDTTDYESAWMQDSGSGKRKLLDEKLAGLGDIDSAGRKRPNKKL